MSVELYQSLTDASGQNKHIWAGEWQRELESSKMQIQILLKTKLINK